MHYVLFMDESGAPPTSLPAAAEIKHGGQTLIVVEYEEWKTRVMKRQH